MIEEINDNLEKYLAKWQAFVAARQNQEFFKNLKPVTVGWKAADEADYKQFYEVIHDHCDKIVETWMNGRWIAKMHLKDQKLAGNIEIIKLMQRRPDSDDALGLDHVDFYASSLDIEQILSAEPELKWTRESNDAVENYQWISIWFEGTEAKLKNGTVLEIVSKELQDLNQKILNS